ncbi:MAG: 3-deoxy-D-manno-octulosonic acid transferase [Syntrophobacteraceae bacterium]
MLPARLAYNLVLSTAGYGVLKILSYKMPEDQIFRKGRSGCYEADPFVYGSPRIWFHAASVGEVTGAIPTLYALRDQLNNAAVYLTVGTPQGFRFACSQLPEWVKVFPFPLDFPWVLKRAFRTLRPDLYVSFESEFWPNLFQFLEKRGIPAVLLNGRLSRRSADRYALFKPLFQPIFKQFRRLAMLTEEDRENVLRLGVSPERTLVLGSSKYDGLLTKARPEKEELWRKVLKVSKELPVVVGGSLRGSECTVLLEIFEALKAVEPRLVGVFAPRHLERIPEMARWLEDRGVPFQLLSRIEEQKEAREASIVLVDRIGILLELYSLGDLIFCGGTIEPIGGHNILEPAAWNKPVFYGPHVEKVFEEHKALQKVQGSFEVRDSKELLGLWSRWIKHYPDLALHGENAGLALKKLCGVTEKQVELIMNCLRERGF